VVTLDIRTGKLKWYFEFTRYDTHDWDAEEPLVLVDETVGRQFWLERVRYRLITIRTAAGKLRSKSRFTRSEPLPPLRLLISSTLSNLL